MLARVVTALVLAPTVVLLVWFGPPTLLAAIAALVAILALVEFLKLGERSGLRAFLNWTIVCAAAIFFVQYAAGLTETHTFSGGNMLVRTFAGGVFSLDLVFIAFLLGAAGIVLAMKRPLHDALPAISVSSAGLLFIALPFSYLVRLDEIEIRGRQLVLFTLCLIWAGDIVAYFVGRSIGRVKMAPALSPKKTWEGAAGNVIASLAVGYGFAVWMHADVLVMLLIAALANIAGQMGDLLESSYKRGASVKDSSGLLPGHGGMLDRIDSLILAAPVVWILFQWLGEKIVAP
ncbi:MAG TPA: phosphatidate cytidylyltransferase [Candidatus Acidoferrales bacterium]|nr:phosphatidate cytidylyltransferase [Candidatus Acidoferrales bacterium]